jgi:small multidrug resistance pump
MSGRLVYFVALGAALVLNATANLMMKFGIERFKAAGVTAEQGVAAVVGALASNWVLVLGLCLFAMNVMFYTFALKGLPISMAYPIMVTTGFAIIVVVAGIYLHERLSVAQWVGVGLILVGVWLVGSQAQKQLGGPARAMAAEQVAGEQA